MTQKPTFYEFFAGGGMARAGLGDGWRCLFANDFDQKKAAVYAENWGSDQFRVGDIHDLSAKDLPGKADLAWASFPCQDLSLAGNGAGLSGERSGAFWGFWNVINSLRLNGRQPSVLVLENVVGAVTSNGSGDFCELCLALHLLGYRVGAMILDAVHFLPQSRPRLFLVAVSSEIKLDAALIGLAPDFAITTKALVQAHAKLRNDVKSRWLWWRMPKPAKPNTALIDLLEETPDDVAWHSQAETARLLSLMSDTNLAKLQVARQLGVKVAGTVYRRTRLDGNGLKVQRAEVRFDGVAGCLRTPGGGSSRQFILVVDNASVRSRLLSKREAARLMGLPETYKLPRSYNDAYHLLGDGVVAPVVSFIEKT